MLVPRSSTVALHAFLANDGGERRPRTTVPAPAKTIATQITTPLTNPYELFRKAAGGQPVELRTLASYLGSSAHIAAAAMALRFNSALPTSLVPRHGSWAALKAYDARLPEVAQAAGHGLVAGLHGKIAAVEFPVYFFGLAADNAFVHSRIDCLTRTAAGGIAVWEFKTKWGAAANVAKRPLLADLRQVALYGYMLWMQTGIKPERLHVRYAVVDPTGSVGIVTHGYAFDGPTFKWALADALHNATAYVDARFVSLGDVARAVHKGSSNVLPALRVLEMVGSKPLLDPRASAEPPKSMPPWSLRSGALWLAKPKTATVYAHPKSRDAQLKLDAKVKVTAKALAKPAEAARCTAKLKRQLATLYGPPSTDVRHDTAEVAIVRTLNRGINALVAKDARDAPPGFAHGSHRAKWSKSAVDAGRRHLRTVAAQVKHEVDRACRRARRGTKAQ